MIEDLRLYDSMAREVSSFRPIEEGRAGIYTCGPTVYAYAHIGNLRAYVFADTVRRALLWKGLDVTHVMNITDVGHLISDEDEGEDKVEVASRREGRTIWELAEHYTAAFMEDVSALRILTPTTWCRATEHVPEMIDFAERLEAGGWCYRLPTGLYFDTGRDPSYGVLARLNLEGQREGARVETVAGRRSPADFAVWRATPAGERRQMEWDSPWGPGAPGWHLECSAMSIEYLGPHFDVHTGGVDHIPVHHVNEIAQSQAYLDDHRPWVNRWMHCEFINLAQAKMSKSAGTGIRLADLAASGFHPAVYRYFLLGGHYRAQMDFDWDALHGSRTALRRILERLAGARADPDPAPPTLASASSQITTASGQAHLEQLDAAVSADLNTSRALAVLASACRDDSLPKSELGRLARCFDAVLGLGLTELSPDDLEAARRRSDVDEDEIERLVAARAAARAERDWVAADALRQRLAELGVTVKDSPAGSTWSWT